MLNRDNSTVHTFQAMSVMRAGAHIQTRTHKHGVLHSGCRLLYRIVSVCIVTILLWYGCFCCHLRYFYRRIILILLSEWEWVRMCECVRKFVFMCSSLSYKHPYTHIRFSSFLFVRSICSTIFVSWSTIQRHINLWVVCVELSWVVYHIRSKWQARTVKQEVSLTSNNHPAKKTH